ncbi:MAG: hypothetical protein IJZ36_01240, partial [Bacilli bacterium]|nr:hypothetical protein [Bacilli bacterium]
MLFGNINVYAASKTCDRCGSVYNASTEIQTDCLVCQMQSKGDLNIKQDGEGKCDCKHEYNKTLGQMVCYGDGTCQYCVHIYSSDIRYLASELNALFAEIPTEAEIAAMANANSISTASVEPMMMSFGLRNMSMESTCDLLVIDGQTGEFLIDTIVESGTVFDETEIPLQEYEGFVFEGFYVLEEKVTSGYVISEDVIITAIYKPIEEVKYDVIVVDSITEEILLEDSILENTVFDFSLVTPIEH